MTLLWFAGNVGFCALNVAMYADYGHAFSLAVAVVNGLVALLMVGVFVSERTR